MDFDLTDGQRLSQDPVRGFVDERVLPNAVENDIEHRLDMSGIEGMAEIGQLGIGGPEGEGGPGAPRGAGGVRRRRPRLRGRGARLRGDRTRRSGVPDTDLGPCWAQLARAAALRK